MKIAVIGASGRSGRFVVKEALSRGHQVTAFVRNAAKMTENDLNIIEKDLFNIKYEDISDQDVIIDAFGTWEQESLELHQSSLKHLSDILSNQPNRLIVVGSAGSLYVNAEHSLRLIESPEMPEMYKPLSTSMVKAYDQLSARKDVNYTYISPPLNFSPDGERTGKYISGQDEFILNSQGESYISYADYAVAVIDEAEHGKHLKRRFTVISE